MARQKLSEYRAKTLLYQALELPYAGLAIDTAGEWAEQISALSPEQTYVVKVDQAIKGRFKQGLVLLDRPTATLAADVAALTHRGFRYLLIEPFQPHTPDAERYLAIERQRGGNVCLYAAQGGIEVEAQAGAIKRGPLPKVAAEVERITGLPQATLHRLNAAFDQHYFGFLELNPLILANGIPQLLDAAVEVDAAADGLVAGAWAPADYRRHGARAKLAPELAVDHLAAQSRASFSLEALNPDGQVFLLLSGGGASVVIADEVANLGSGPQLANYGEYSGNPSEAEAHTYAAAIIALLLASRAEHKVLIIAGGVANFTDIRATFRGLIRALSQAKPELQAQHVQVYVRRGGPHEAEGLAAMHTFLEAAGLLGQVAGPELMLTAIVERALTSLPEATS